MLSAVCAGVLIPHAAAQAPGPDAASVAKAIEARCAAAQQYTFDAVLELARKNGEESRETLASYKIKVAVAAEGKYLLWVSEKNQLEYLIISDGRNTWAYMPDLNRYARLDAVEPRILPDPDESFLTGVGDDSRDPVLCSKLVMPILARLTRHAALTEMNRSADVNIAGEEQQLPILSILSEKDQHGNQTLAEIVVHPETFDPVQAEWTKTVITGEEQRFAILKIEFEKLRIGDPIPASYFVFSPPADAQLVDELPIPGLNGSALLNQPAPDFELEAAAGTKTRLSDLRGHAVLLAFSGGGCVTCSQQLADLAKIQSEYKTKGVAVLGIATEPNSVPTSAGGAPVPAILHDPDAKIHRLYRVQLVPTVVVIDAQGKVIRFLPGARDVATIEAALKTAGL